MGSRGVSSRRPDGAKERGTAGTGQREQSRKQRNSGDYVEVSPAGTSCVEEGCEGAHSRSFPRTPAVELEGSYRALSHAQEAGLDLVSDTDGLSGRMVRAALWLSRPVLLMWKMIIASFHWVLAMFPALM